MRQDLSRGRLQFAGILDSTDKHAHCSRHGGEVRVDQFDAGFQHSGHLHLKLNEAECAVVENNYLYGQLLLHERDEIAHQYCKAAVAAE